MGVSYATYERVALEDGDATWEYVCGQLREKPGMTQEHNRAASLLAFFIQSQLPIEKFEVLHNAGRLQTSAGNAFVPDVVVIPIQLAASQRGTGELETYAEPVPFVAETWSKSTGNYDSRTKLPEYQARGDLVVWLVHPYDHLVRAFARRPHGDYEETTHTGGSVPIPSLPGVAVDPDRLFGSL